MLRLIGFTALDDEAVLGEGVNRFALFGVRRAREAVVTQAIEEVRHFARDDELRVGERVHQENVAPIRQWDTNIENGGLHGFPSRPDLRTFQVVVPAGRIAGGNSCSSVQWVVQPIFRRQSDLSKESHRRIHHRGKARKY